MGNTVFRIINIHNEHCQVHRRNIKGGEGSEASRKQAKEQSCRYRSRNISDVVVVVVGSEPRFHESWGQGTPLPHGIKLISTTTRG